MTLRIGFTGTRRGMTLNQKAILEAELFANFQQNAEFYHGGCAGADLEASAIAEQIGYKIFCYRPKELISKYYLQRNRDIVNNVTIMFAAPRQPNEILRSGTWATIRYARKQLNKTLERLSIIEP